MLVNGATGAIGSAAVQLLKGLGVHVTAVCDTAHLELVSGLGADRVIDYTGEDFTLDEQRYDVVLDAVGKSTFGRCRRLLKPGGSYSSSELGPLCQNPVLALVTALLPGKTVIFPFPTDNQAIVQHLKELIESGTFSARHRQELPVGPDRRGLPVRRDRAEDRQRRDRGRAAAVAPAGLDRSRPRDCLPVEPNLCAPPRRLTGGG